MAEILIKAVDAVNADPEKDKGCYKKGDIVCVMPDGHKWGGGECSPAFVIVKIPGASVASLETYAQEKTEPYTYTDPDPRMGKRTIQKFLLRRKYSIPAADINLTLLAGGALTTNSTVFLSKVAAK